MTTTTAGSGSGNNNNNSGNSGDSSSSSMKYGDLGSGFTSGKHMNAIHIGFHGEAVCVDLSSSRDELNCATLRNSQNRSNIMLLVIPSTTVMGMDDQEKN